MIEDAYSIALLMLIYTLGFWQGYTYLGRRGTRP